MENYVIELRGESVQNIHEMLHFLVKDFEIKNCNEGLTGIAKNILKQLPNHICAVIDMKERTLEFKPRSFDLKNYVVGNIDWTQLKRKLEQKKTICNTKVVCCLLAELNYNQIMNFFEELEKFFPLENLREQWFEKMTDEVKFFYLNVQDGSWDFSSIYWGSHLSPESILEMLKERE